MKIKDDVLGNNVFERLKETIELPEIPWFYVESTAYDDRTPSHMYDFSFSHQIFKNGQSYSSISQFLETCCLQALDNIGEKCNELLRIRLGMITATADRIIHTPHVDYEQPHKSALLYINDSDGDTYFYKEFFKPGVLHSADVEQQYTLEDSVTPKANRLVYFDGLQYHASSTPTKTSRRLVMNFNYV